MTTNCSYSFIEIETERAFFFDIKTILLVLLNLNTDKMGHLRLPKMVFHAVFHAII